MGVVWRWSLTSPVSSATFVSSRGRQCTESLQNKPQALSEMPGGWGPHGQREPVAPSPTGMSVRTSLTGF